ncbi:RNA polymerase sigma factor [Sphingosinicella soli]|uniref:RNA polymerase sigma factor n=1 Tax=Sphingosinicella soli TaxID=333708 RepID=A0A7W7B4L1_9SPHN|nr:RNA polymerase sigma factor [Sphingosinicella soli]MBB4633882.1 RNA polymerase sigma-70 factor (ECF subfamily) [Sphingosinicella soli]
MSGLLRIFMDYETTLRRVVARYRRRGEDVDDLVQETFLRVYAADQKQEIRDPKAFLIRVAKNLAITEARRKEHSTTEFYEDSGGSDVFVDERHGSVEDQVDGRRKLLVLSQAIASLKPELRQSLLMCKVEKLKFRQIATRLDVSVSTVEKRVAAALIACNAYLRNHGYDPAEFGAAGEAKARTGTVLKMAEMEARKVND